MMLDLKGTMIFVAGLLVVFFVFVFIIMPNVGESIANQQSKSDPLADWTQAMPDLNPANPRFECNGEGMYVFIPRFILDENKSYLIYHGTGFHIDTADLWRLKSVNRTTLESLDVYLTARCY